MQVSSKTAVPPQRPACSAPVEFDLIQRCRFPASTPSSALTALVDPTFKHPSKLNPKLPTVKVAEGRAVVADAGTQLTTNALASCSGLCFTAGGRSFLAHVDSASSTEALEKAIRDNFPLAVLKNPAVTIAIFHGTSFGNRCATDVIANTLKNLDLFRPGKVVLMDVGGSDVVGVNAKGTFVP